MSLIASTLQVLAETPEFANDPHLLPLRWVGATGDEVLGHCPRTLACGHEDMDNRRLAAQRLRQVALSRERGRRNSDADEPETEEKRQTNRADPAQP